MATQWQQQQSHQHSLLYHQTGQYQQPGQYPQHGQYQQPAPYQQLGQYPLPQQHQQDQTHQLQRTVYNGYQQHNIPQHFSQPHPPQQHSPRQYGPYQQPYQQPKTAYGQPSAQITPPQFCYNCASPDHFAQDCPEPKRDVPAGALDPVRFANPLKQRARSASTVATRYQAPPYANQPYASPQGCAPTAALQSQSGLSACHGQRSLTAPTLAQSPAQQQYIQQQWQLYYQHQQAYQHGSYHQQGPHHHHQQQHRQQLPYSAPYNQAVGYSNGPPQPSQASAQSSRHRSASQMHHPQYTQTEQMQPLTASMNPGQPTQQPSDATSNPAEAHRGHQHEVSFSRPPHLALPITPHHDDVGEAEEDDLNSLDIPDMPLIPSNAGTNFPLANTIVSPPVNLIGTPLPANFVVADTLYPMASPAPEKHGCCKSKYLGHNNSDTLCGNIKESKYWNDFKDDPIFAMRPNDDDLASLDETLSKTRERYVNGEVVEDTISKSRSQSCSVSVRAGSGDFRGDLEALERNLAELKARAAEMERNRLLTRGKRSSLQQSAILEKRTDKQIMVKEEHETPPQSASPEKASKSAQETEDVLASLGVTGPPKPVVANGGPYHTSARSPPNDNFVPRSRSSSKVEASRLPQGYHANGSPEYPHGYGFPPPPSHHRQHSFPESADGSPSSSGPGQTNAYYYSINVVDHGNGNINYGAERQLPPVSRKRSYTHRDSTSDEDETPGRRQEDDITPKHKRRQPKVEAAYGRRW